MAVDVCTGELDSLILPHLHTGCMQLFPHELWARQPDERIVIVMDSARWHRGDTLKQPESVSLRRLPAYAPELDPIGHVERAA